MLHLHTLIYNSFYGLWRYMVKWKFTFNFEFLLYCLYTSVKGNFFNNDVNYVIPWRHWSTSGQLKIFNNSVIDPECLLKNAATSFCLITFYPFQATLYVLIYYYFIWELRFTCFPKWSRITINTKFLKLLQFGYLFRFCNRYFCYLNLTMSPGFSDPFALFLRHDLIIICFRRFSLKWGFWFPRKCFVFLGVNQIIFIGCMGSHSRHTIKNIQFKLVTTYCLKLRYIDLFGLNFSNFVLRIVCIIWWWSLKPVSKAFAFINDNFEFVISKSMHEPPSPLKHVFCFIIL